jgi:5-methylcytosine-specific restriction endonuclease McrA
MRARSVCAAPRCPNAATHQGRCDEHRRRISGHRWRQLVAQIVARDRAICWLCGKPGATSADHVRRVVDGGTDEPSNLRAAHVLCNQRRG